MPWCPNCREEYKEGIIKCPDCNITLVKSLETNEEVSDFLPVYTFDSKELADKFSGYLNYSGILSIESQNEDNTITISVKQKDIKKAKKHFTAFYSVEASNALEKELSFMREASDEALPDPLDFSQEQEEKKTAFDSAVDFDEPTAQDELEDALSDIVYSTETYEKRSDKASDALSTAITFMVFGMIGFVIVLLSIFNVIKFLTGTLFYITSSVIFGAFIVIGISSYISYRKLSKEALQEEELTNNLMDWLSESFTKENYSDYKDKIFSDNPNTTEELLYFKVSSHIKDMITKQFGEIDESYLDYITDEYINNTFPNPEEAE